MAGKGSQTVGGKTTVYMPQLGESVTEGQVSKWLKQPGDKVEKYEALLEVITDKVNAEVPSPVDGVLAEINVQEGETVAVGTLICSITSADNVAADAAAAPAAGATEAAPEVAAPAAAAPPAPVPAAGASEATNGVAPAHDRANRASPAVRRLADEHNLDISVISGTGIGRRVTKKDVEEFIAGGGPSSTTAPAASPASAPLSPPAKVMAGDELVPLNPMRKAIAEHMVRSRRTSPHAWCAIEVDMTNIVKLRAAEREAFRSREGVDLTYVPFVIKATVEALREHPGVNATFTPEGVLRKKAVNISVAVGLDDGLIVPVIHDADRLSIAGLAHTLDDLATRARAGQLKLPDIEGGTFCVNNPGTYGSIMSAPIINQPQAGIMTMEAIVKKPVVLPGDLIGIRSMMFTCLSFDHRVMDGGQAISFLKSVKTWLEAATSQTPIY
ncbi:MAG: dihydrolipoamide acetyltransferase family protein [Candidatus Dormibacteria bacterium]